MRLVTQATAAATEACTTRNSRSLSELVEVRRGVAVAVAVAVAAVVVAVVVVALVLVPVLVQVAVVVVVGGGGAAAAAVATVIVGMIVKVVVVVIKCHRHSATVSVETVAVVFVIVAGVRRWDERKTTSVWTNRRGPKDQGMLAIVRVTTIANLSPQWPPSRAAPSPMSQVRTSP